MIDYVQVGNFLNTSLPLSFAKDLNLNGTFKALSFLSLQSLSNNSSPAFEERTKILLA